MSYELAKKFGPLHKPYGERSRRAALHRPPRRFPPPLLAPALQRPDKKPCLAVPANSDSEGYLEAEKAGLKHVAVRSSGRESDYRPIVSNLAPRPAGWRPAAAGA